MSIDFRAVIEDLDGVALQDTVGRGKNAKIIDVTLGRVAALSLMAPDPELSKKSDGVDFIRRLRIAERVINAGKIADMSVEDIKLIIDRIREVQSGTPMLVARCLSLLDPNMKPEEAKAKK